MKFEGGLSGLIFLEYSYVTLSPSATAISTILPIFNIFFSIPKHTERKDAYKERDNPDLMFLKSLKNWGQFLYPGVRCVGQDNIVMQSIISHTQNCLISIFHIDTYANIKQ